MDRSLVCSLIVSLFAATLALAEPPAAPATDPGVAQEAELRLLRASMDRQQKENAALKARVAELTAQLQELGIPPVGATTQPSANPAAKPKRIVFVLDYHLWWRKPHPQEEIVKAVTEMTADQWFNVVLRPHPWRDPVALQKTMVPVNDKGREQLQQFFKGDLSLSPDALPAMALAIKWRPDVIWYVGSGPGDSVDPEKFLAEVRKLNATARVKINTTVQFVPENSPRRRFLWQLANDSGGTCLDPKGQPLAEPPATVKVELPKPPPPRAKPSVLKTP